MKILLILTIGLIAAIVALQAYVRLAPTDADRWHTDPGLEDTTTDTVERLPGGVRVSRHYDLPPDVLLKRIDRIAKDTPRTVAIAGSPATGMTTYRTRSALWGFPDFTTVAADPAPDGGSRLRIYARLRFGQGDTGVNASRVDSWLGQLP